MRRLLVLAIAVHKLRIHLGASSAAFTVHAEVAGSPARRISQSAPVPPFAYLRALH